MQFFNQVPALAEAIGLAGFCIYVLTYSLLTLRVVKAPSIPYFCMNLTASSCVLVGLSASFNLAAAMIQVFWITISLVGIALHLLRLRVQSADQSAETVLRTTPMRSALGGCVPRNLSPGSGIRVKNAAPRSGSYPARAVITVPSASASSSKSLE